MYIGKSWKHGECWTSKLRTVVKNLLPYSIQYNPKKIKHYSYHCLGVSPSEFAWPGPCQMVAEWRSHRGGCEGRRTLADLSRPKMDQKKEEMGDVSRQNEFLKQSMLSIQANQGIWHDLTWFNPAREILVLSKMATIGWFLERWGSTMLFWGILLRRQIGRDITLSKRILSFG